MASTAASSTLSLAWCFEHLLTLPPEVMDDELVRHFAALLVKPQASGKLSMPAPVSARMMLRHLSSGAQLLPAKEVVELLSLIHLLAQQAAQFSSSMQMETLDPGANGMLMDAVTQAVVQRALCVPAGGGAGVGEELAQLVEASHGALTAEDEQLQQRMSELDGVISSAPEGDELQQLKAHYPDASFHSRVKAYADQALAALGPTHLQAHAEACLAGIADSSNATFGDLYTSPTPASPAGQQAPAAEREQQAAGTEAVPAQVPQSTDPHHTIKRRRVSVDAAEDHATAEGGSAGAKTAAVEPAATAAAAAAAAAAAGPSEAAGAGQRTRSKSPAPSTAARPDATAAERAAAGTARRTRSQSPAPPGQATSDAPPGQQGAATASKAGAADAGASPARPAKKGRTMEWDSPSSIEEGEELQEMHTNQQARTSSQRRVYSRWSKEETDLFIKLTNKYGVGNWELIKSHAGEALAQRRSVDLKDKWRNLVKSKLV